MVFKLTMFFLQLTSIFYYYVDTAQTIKPNHTPLHHTTKPSIPQYAQYAKYTQYTQYAYVPDVPLLYDERGFIPYMPMIQRVLYTIHQSCLCAYMFIRLYAYTPKGQLCLYAKSP